MSENLLLYTILRKESLNKKISKIIQYCFFIFSNKIILYEKLINLKSKMNSIIQYNIAMKVKKNCNIYNVTVGFRKFDLI